MTIPEIRHPVIEIFSSAQGPQIALLGFQEEETRCLRELFLQRHGKGHIPPKPLSECFPCNAQYAAIDITAQSANFKNFKTHFLAIVHLCDCIFGELASPSPDQEAVAKYRNALTLQCQKSKLAVEWLSQRKFSQMLFVRKPNSDYFRCQVHFLTSSKRGGFSKNPILKGFIPQYANRIREAFRKSFAPTQNTQRKQEMFQEVAIGCPSDYEQGDAAIQSLLEIAARCSQAFVAMEQRKDCEAKLQCKMAKECAEIRGFSFQVKHRILPSDEPDFFVQMRSWRSPGQLKFFPGGLHRSLRKKIQERVERHIAYFWNEKGVIVKISGFYQSIFNYLAEALESCRKDSEEGIQKAKEKYGITLTFSPIQPRAKRPCQPEEAVPAIPLKHTPPTIAIPQLLATPSLTAQSADSELFSVTSLALNSLVKIISTIK